jgi:hypothetical protein
MKYLNSAPFTVPLGGKEFGEGWDRIFAKKPELPALALDPHGPPGNHDGDEPEWEDAPHTCSWSASGKDPGCDGCSGVKFPKKPV